ncbi:MAG: hypothetical protein HZA46_19055 [Planctomycetales bacterium]|nr:hypothetical protein [Planctomycetales bacterium]
MSEYTNCPDIAQWRDLLAGRMLTKTQQALEDHLGDCPRCIQVLEALAEGMDDPPLKLELLRSPPPPVEPELERVIQNVSQTR